MCFYKSSDGWDDVRLNTTVYIHIYKRKRAGQIKFHDEKKKRTTQNEWTNQRTNKNTGYKLQS